MCLLGIKRLNRISVDILVVIRGKALQGLHWTADRTAMTAAEGLWARLLFDPKVFGRLEVIPKYRYDFPNYSTKGYRQLIDWITTRLKALVYIQTPV